MPDGDVFDRHCKRGWKKAASWIVGAGNFDDGIPSALRALGREIKTTGCPGIDQIVGTVIDTLHARDRMVARQHAIERLEQIGIQQGSRATEIAINSSQRLIAEAFHSGTLMAQPSDDELRIEITAQILADLAGASLCPPAVLPELIEEEKASFQEVQARRQHAKELIIAAPETRRMADQLLADPSGASVKLPRIRREKLSQSEILVTALTP